MLGRVLIRLEAAMSGSCAGSAWRSNTGAGPQEAAPGNAASRLDFREVQAADRLAHGHRARFECGLPSDVKAS